MMHMDLSSHTDDGLYITFNGLCMCVFDFDCTRIIFLIYKQSSCDSRSFLLLIAIHVVYTKSDEYNFMYEQNFVESKIIIC